LEYVFDILYQNDVTNGENVSNGDAQNGDSIYVQPLVGCELVSVERRDFDWVFVFGTNVVLIIENQWRLIQNNLIVVTSYDHGQKFGLPAPVDSAQEVLSAVKTLRVQKVSVITDTGDLVVQFSENVYLQCLNCRVDMNPGILIAKR
jgi:hypothetical protein